MSPTSPRVTVALARRVARLVLATTLMFTVAAPLGGPLAGPSAGAQGASTTAPLGLSAPAWISPDLPSEVRISSLWVLPGPDGSPASVDVRFAGPFTPPAGRWRVSVGIGDPSGAWERVSMVWDGSAATGVAEQIEGLAVANLGPVSASVDPSGSVVLGVPAGVLDATGGGLVWAESAIGPDTDPALLVRTPWFPRAVLAGEGAPGLLQGSTLGVLAAAKPGGAAPNSAPAVIDTGVPSVLELNGGTLAIDRGQAPASIGGVAVATAVDLVTLVDAAGSAEVPASGPQVRIDLVGGSVELGVGSVLGPLGPPTADTAPVAPSASWLDGADGAPAPSAPVEVLVDGAFAETGQSDPGAQLAVTVTRVVTGADGSVVVAPGVLADRTWLRAGTDANAAASASPTADRGGQGDAPLVPIAVGTALGALLVGGSMALAGERHRRRRPGPEDPLPVSAAAWTTGTTSVVRPPVPAPSPEPPPITAPVQPPSPAPVTATAPEPKPQPEPAPEPASAFDLFPPPAAAPAPTATPDPSPAPAPEPDDPAPAPEDPAAGSGDEDLFPSRPQDTAAADPVRELDDDIGELAERLRRLSEG